MSKQKNLIIVGGGFGGISVAKNLKGTDIDVTIVDKRNHHLFQPLLYQVATAALSPGDVAIPIRSIFGSSDNIKTILGEVTEIDKDKKILHLKNRSPLNFDYLVLATGSQYNYFGNEEWKDHAPGLKSIDDALNIRERILYSLEIADQLQTDEEKEPYLTYAVIGAGPTGVEMAGAIAEIAKRNMMRDYRNIDPDKTKIYLIEAGPKVLNGYHDSLSEKATRDLEGMGVTVLLNQPVTEVTKNSVTAGGTVINTPNLVWAAGVESSPVLNSLSVEQDKIGRVLVSKDLSIDGYPNIFVIGDAAHVEDKSGEPLPALAPVALQQGKYIAKRIKHMVSGKDTKPFSYTDKGSMATIGRAKAVADIKGFKFSGIAAWLLWSLIHIFFLIGYRNRFRVFAEWIWHYLTFKRGVRIIYDRLYESNSDKDETSSSYIESIK
jgi:NADH dehydrogenase